VLPRLAGQKLLPEEAVRELQAAYAYLRRLENCLQMYRDEQTHRLPADEQQRACLVTAMRRHDWRELTTELESQRDSVARHFANLVLAGEGAAPPTAGASNPRSAPRRRPRISPLRSGRWDSWHPRVSPPRSSN